MPVVSAKFETTWGEGVVRVAGGRLVEVELPPVRQPLEKLEATQIGPEDSESLSRWVTELESYFRGERLCWAVEDIDFHLGHLSPFQRRTVEALMSVPEGMTVSYGDLAEMAGHPRAARAVGSVMANNPIPIVVPCHRVIRSDGSLGRYGMDASWKERLLDHERRSGRDG